MPEELQAASQKPRPRWVARIWASADDTETPRKWMANAALVVLGAVVSQLLGMSGCNTTPNQLRVSDLTTRVGKLEDAANDLPHKYKPREELEDDDRLRSRSYDQLNTRLNHVEQLEEQLVLGRQEAR